MKYLQLHWTTIRKVQRREAVRYRPLIEVIYACRIVPFTMTFSDLQHHSPIAALSTVIVDTVVQPLTTSQLR